METTFTDSPRRRPRAYACTWCGSPMVDSEMGRRRKYCKRSCRQRAYEQRASATGRTIPDDAIILTAADVENFGDRMFALRCAAEDLTTAVAENADHQTLSGLVDDLLGLAKDAERLR